jgi:hypothetical protein
VAKAGIPVKIDSAHGVTHNKVMIIDDEIIITGSFNFTKGKGGTPFSFAVLAFIELITPILGYFFTPLYRMTYPG